MSQHAEFRGRFAHGNAFADEGQGIALESDDAGAFLNHDKPPSPKKRERSVVLCCVKNDTANTIGCK